MKKDNEHKIETRTLNVSEMREDSRDTRIDALEKARLNVTKRLEILAQKYADISGEKKLGKRKYSVGNSPNDWKNNYL